MVGDEGGHAARGRGTPLLANVYLHYVFDLWVDGWRKRVAQGDVMVVRYADDLVVGFQHMEEAERSLEEFRERLANFGLELHPEKTRLIEFGRYAAANRKQRGEGEPESFAFLGFTHRCGTNSRGNFVLWRQMVRKRLEEKLQQVKQRLRERMHEPVPKVGEWLGRVVNGHYQYHGVPGNWASMPGFRERVGRPGGERWKGAAKRLVHPYPEVRFDATNPR